MQLFMHASFRFTLYYVMPMSLEHFYKTRDMQLIIHASVPCILYYVMPNFGTVKAKDIEESTEHF